MLIEAKNHGDVRMTDRTRTSYTFQVTNRCSCDLCSAAIISRAATGTVGSRKFQLPLWIASCSVHGSPRSNVNSYVTTNVYYVTFRYPYTWCSRVFQSCLFHPCDLVPRFPVPRFQRPPIYIDITAYTSHSLTPSLCIAQLITSLGTLSKAFSKSTKPK